MASAKITRIYMAEGRSLSEMTNLETVSINNNLITEFPDVKYSASLARLYLAGNLLSGLLDLTGCDGLSYLDITGNSGITEVGFDNLNQCLEFESSGTSLSEENVDLILDALDSSGITTGRCYLDGGSNASPSIAGLAIVTSLESKSWDVTVN
jgi:Leucine-rich repeat (LRR) protein